MTGDQEGGLEQLQVWQRSLALGVKICRSIIPDFPVEEKWALASQLRRSSQSISANIAEGYGRFYYQDTVRFCYIARGSLEEVFTQLNLANRLGYLSDLEYTNLTLEVREIRKMLNGYIQYLKKSKRGEKEPGSDLLIRETGVDYEFEPNDCSPDPLID